MMVAVLRLYTRLMLYGIVVSSSLWLHAGSTRTLVNCPDDDVTCSDGAVTCVLLFDGADSLEDYITRPLSSSVEMDCSVRANPKATITWLRDEATKIQPIRGKYIINDFTLKIESLRLEDGGNYTCIVSNQCGNISHTFQLDVQQRVAIAPIIEIVENQTAVVGENVTFTCKIVFSDSQPLLQWLRHYQVNGSYTNKNGEPYVEILQHSSPDVQRLELTNVTLEDETWYTCLVANNVGSNYQSAWLEVLNKPELSSPLDTQSIAAAENGLHRKIVIYSTVSGSVVIVIVVISVLLYIIRNKRKHTPTESTDSENHSLQQTPSVSHATGASAETNVDNRNRRISSNIANSSDSYLSSSVINSSDSC